MKKTWTFLLTLILVATLSHAAQTPVLTEIEQLQEKLWYLQRDISAHKATLDQQRAELSQLAAKMTDGNTSLSDRLDQVAQSVALQQGQAAALQAHLQSLEESITALVDEMNLLNAGLQTQGEHAAAWEERLKAVQAEATAGRQALEQDLEATRGQLAELRQQLQQTAQTQEHEVNRIVLWGAGVALAMALLLTIGFFLGRDRPRERQSREGNGPRHGL